MDKEFYTLLRDGILVQGMLTLIIWISIVVGFMLGYEIPEQLIWAGISILTYYFGVQTEAARHRLPPNM